MFSESSFHRLACTAAAMKARGTLRKHFTKPSEQVAAPDSILKQLHQRQMVSVAQHVIWSQQKLWSRIVTLSILRESAERNSAMRWFFFFPGVGLEFRVEAGEECPVLVSQGRRVEDVFEAAGRTPGSGRGWGRDLKMAENALFNVKFPKARARTYCIT